MERILEWLNKIKDKLIDFWNKYTAKQKTVIITVVLAIFLALVLLVYFLSRPVYREFMRTGDRKAANDIATALDEAGLANEVHPIDDETTLIEVEQADLEEATMLIGSDENFNSAMTWDKALTNDMSTTKAERQAKMRLALQVSIAQGLEGFSSIQEANVFIAQTEDDGTYTSQLEDPSVSVSLELSAGEVPEDFGHNIARFVANAAKCKTTDKIIIMDTRQNLLFGGANDSVLGGSIKDSKDFENKLRNTLEQDVKALTLKVGFDDVEIGSSAIRFDMDKVERLSEEYTIPEGREEGYVLTDYTYESTGESASGGIPGTDSNSDETDYMLEDIGGSNTSTTLIKNTRQLNKITEKRELEVGAVNREESSISLVLNNYTKVYEETLEEQGLLENITFEQYADADENNQKTAIEVPPELYDLVSNNTGIDPANITILAYDQPIYQAAESTGINPTNYLMIILAVLIAALLIFVIIKGTSPVKVEELEPELSVEELLATTADEAALAEIDAGSKSELQALVDKFVEENPEAVALLLRNWLNEDWS
ncbi:MAG: hypothetical protein LBR68_04105 [Lachnoclostridium sp.]|jgi:flagellar M-ring protein FliF|nr:hypothetical protein [Lachnoclostridium sp.]